MVTRAAGIRLRWWGIVLLSVAVATIAGTLAVSHGPDPQLSILADRSEIPAGGGSVHLTIRSSIPLPSSGLDATIVDGGHSARVARTYFDAGSWHVTIQSKALAGNVKLAATLPPFVGGAVSIKVLGNDRDSVGDGTPDIL